MTEWKLVRNSDGYVAMIYYQLEQPAFNTAFGNVNDFHFESHVMNPVELSAYNASQRLELYPRYEELLLALYDYFDNNNATPIQNMMNEVQAINVTFPVVVPIGDLPPDPVPVEPLPPDGL